MDVTRQLATYSVHRLVKHNLFILSYLYDFSAIISAYILRSACKHATVFCQECVDAYAPAVMLKLMTLTHQNTD